MYVDVFSMGMVEGMQLLDIMCGCFAHFTFPTMHVISIIIIAHF